MALLQQTTDPAPPKLVLLHLLASDSSSTCNNSWSSTCTSQKTKSSSAGDGVPCNNLWNTRTIRLGQSTNTTVCNTEQENKEGESNNAYQTEKQRQFNSKLKQCNE